MDLALFDFDGTITYEDTFTGFIYYAVHPYRLALGKVVLSPLIFAYKLGIISGTTARSRVFQFGFRSEKVSDIQAKGRLYSRDIVSKVIRPEAMARIAWHKARGDRIVVVSASLRVYLADWCETQGLDLICTELEEKNGRLTGRYLGGDCSGKRKAERIIERFPLPDYAKIYAYGDTKEDYEMLMLAHKRFYRWKELP